jgi:hypothetical protein
MASRHPKDWRPDLDDEQRRVVTQLVIERWACNDARRVNNKEPTKARKIIPAH